MKKLLIISIGLLTCFLVHAAEIIVEHKHDSLGFEKPIPVSISGFTGEVDSVLKQDLLFMGFEAVAPDQAQLLITGNNNSRVEGRLIEKFNKHEIFGRAYTGGSLRAQTHRFADDISMAMKRPGIAQKKITFKVESGLSRSEVYVADYDGHNARAVTGDKNIVAAPSWAGPQSLVYASYKLGPLYIYSHDLPSGQRKAVCSYPGMNASPAVSPDGGRIAMVLSKGGNPDVYVSNLDGSGLVQLTRTRESESSPCWSPDGQTICYSTREGGSIRLYTVPASGGTTRPLATTGTPNPTEPSWSPDGKWIAYTSKTADFTICIVDAKGGAGFPLVSGEDPCWAPNSRALIFCKGRDHGKVLSLLDVPSKHVKDIARISESNSQPSWAIR
jgi:TolB protein